MVVVNGATSAIASKSLTQTGACVFTASFGVDGDPPNSARTTVPGNCETLPCAPRRFTITPNNAACLRAVDFINVGASWLRVDYSNASPETGTVSATQRNPTGAQRQAEITLVFEIGGSVVLTIVQCAGTCP
jgi:hypothetical protein